MRCWAALITAALMAAGSPAAARDTNEIILRLEDDQPSARAEPQVELTVPPSTARPPSPPDVDAASVVLMDAATGQVLYSKNPHVRRPNASTTKIMTAILLIEHCKMTDKVRVSPKACQTPFTSLHLKPGEQISVRDLLVGMMVRSGNDAAVAAAEHVAGSVAKFAALMNKKAVEIGCKNTHFVNPNGLYAKGHYSSAYDLCLMARYAFRYPVFNEAVRTQKHVLDSRTVNRKDLAVFSRSKFMKYYPGADGVKSGYVKQAGYCYVGSATREGWRLVSAVLKSDNSNLDTMVLMDYGFTNFEPVIVAQAGADLATAQVRGGAAAEVPIAPASDLRVAVPKHGARVTTRCETQPLTAPVSKGTKVGTVVASVNGVDICRVDLLATQDVDIGFIQKAWIWTRTCGVVIVCLVLGGKYGAALTKAPGRRRRRVTASLRNPDRYR